MDGYILLKTIHVVSATILFGTGLGIAFFFLMGFRSDDTRAAYEVARTTTIADMLFTLTAGVVQPLTGFAMLHRAGIDPWSRWLEWTYALYAVALACWLPVVWLQLRMRDMLRAKLGGEAIDEVRLRHYFRIWFVLGWPAFLGLIAILTNLATRWAISRPSS